MAQLVRGGGMKVSIICVGRLKDDAEQAIVERYLRRFEQTGRAVGFGAASVVELPESKARSAKQRKAAEAEALRARLPASDPAMALDERGKPLTSHDFARRVGQLRDNGASHLHCVIGGPDGLDARFLDSVDSTVSFGGMTLPHGLIRAVLAEQLYRAATILAGHPYHRE